MNPAVRKVVTTTGILAVLLVLGTVGWLLRPGSGGGSDAYYTPGVTPKREDCVIAKMKTYNKLDKLILQQIAFECELTVQSIEGHEVLRKEWETRQAQRAAEPKPEAPATPVPEESDRVRRVWR